MRPGRELQRYRPEEDINREVHGVNEVLLQVLSIEEVDKLLSWFDMALLVKHEWD